MNTRKLSKFVKNTKHFKKNNRYKKKHSKRKNHRGGAMNPASALPSSVDLQDTQIIQLSIIYKKFFDKYFEIFVISELPKYIIKKYLSDIRVPIKLHIIDAQAIKFKLFEDKVWNLIIRDLCNFFNILYNRINQEVSDIHIFSVSTGNGFLEALFAIYLKVIQHKPIVKIMFFDPYDTTAILQAYKYNKDGMDVDVFDYVIGVLQKINKSEDYTLNALQIKLLMRDKSKQPLYTKIIDEQFKRIDIFIAVHAQGIISYKYNGKNNNFVYLLNLYVNLLTSSAEKQLHIPMLWLYYDVSLDFKNEQSLISSMKIINKQYIDDAIDNYKHFKDVYKYTDATISKKLENFIRNFNFSTLDNLHKIGMDEIQEYPGWDI